MKSNSSVIFSSIAGGGILLIIVGILTYKLYKNNDENKVSPVTTSNYVSGYDVPEEDLINRGSNDYEVAESKTENRLYSQASTDTSDINEPLPGMNGGRKTRKNKKNTKKVISPKIKKNKRTRIQKKRMAMGKTKKNN